MAVSNIL